MFSCISSFHSRIILPTTNDSWMPSIIIIKVLFLGDISVGNVSHQVTWKTDRADLQAGSLLGATSVRHWRKQVWTQRQAERQWSYNTGLNGGPLELEWSWRLVPNWGKGLGLSTLYHQISGRQSPRGGRGTLHKAAPFSCGLFLERDLAMSGRRWHSQQLDKWAAWS